MKKNLNQLRESYLLSSDWHIHTNYVHGRHTISECIEYARKRGLKLIVIVEHVRKKLTYDFAKLLKEVNKEREKSKIKVLLGAEAKVIDINGDLDISRKVKRKLDVLYGAFHSWFYQTTPTKEEYIETLLNMIKKREFDVWAHPFLLPTNYGIQFNDDEFLEIINAIKKYKIFIELNLLYKLPPSDFLTFILEESVPIVIGSDAHSKYEIWDGKKPDFINFECWQKIKEIVRKESDLL